jgi:hypothetical protein
MVLLVPTLRRGNAVWTLQRRVRCKGRGASRLDSHAGAWEPETKHLVYLRRRVLGFIINAPNP